MSDLGAVRAALANQISKVTGLRTLPEAKDQISPPVAIILPGQPYVTYGATMDGAFTVSLRVLIAISDAAPDEKVQRALDAYLGIGAGTTASSIPAALQADPSLGGIAHFAEPIAVSTYGRIQYNGVGYFGARLDVSIGVILFWCSFNYSGTLRVWQTGRSRHQPLAAGSAGAPSSKSCP